MSKEIAIIYQDCPTCGARKKWGEETIKHITSTGNSFRKVSFASQEGQAHCAKAIASGVTSFPFVTDGKIYSTDINDILKAKKTKKVAKKSKKTTKKAKESEDGRIDSES